MMQVIKGGEKLSKEQIVDLIGSIKYLIYARVSTKDQAEFGYSIESQIERCIKHTNDKYESKETEILVLIEPGESGDDPNRPTLNYALHLLEEGVGKYMVVLHPNRLSRDLNLQSLVTNRIWSCGCNIEFVEFDLDKDNPESMLNYHIQGSIAQYNKAKLLADSKRGRITKVKNGKIPGLRRIYGYTFNKETDMLEINEKEADALRLAADWIINHNKSISQVAEELSKIPEMPPPISSYWYQSSLSKMLKNETYIGNFYYGKTEVKKINGKSVQVPKPKEEWMLIKVPPIFDEDTFYKLQNIINTLAKNKRGRPSQSYLLKGLARCGRCGYSVSSGVTSKLKDKVLKYYSCNRKSKKAFESGSAKANRVCRGKNWRVDILDEAIWEYVKFTFENPDEILKKITKDQKDIDRIADLESKLGKFKKSLKDKIFSREKYVDLYASGIIKTKDELSKKIEPLDSSIEMIEKDIVVLQHQMSEIKMNLNEVEEFKKNILIYSQTLEKEQNFEFKKKLIDTFIHQIILHDDKIEVITKWDVNNTHKNQTLAQDEGLIFYVSETLSLTEPNWRGEDFEPKWTEIEDKLDELVSLYWDKLLTFEEIEKKTGIEWWTVKELFKQKDIKRMSLADRAKKKRAKKFDEIYGLIQSGMSLRQIYRDYGYSPQYCKQCLLDQNIKI